MKKEPIKCERVQCEKDSGSSLADFETGEWATSQGIKETRGKKTYSPLKLQKNAARQHLL